jgi:hypothetical protein
MLIGRKLTKILFICLTILFLFSFCITDSANARGGCFAGGTVILTDEGNKPIETLEKGNSVMCQSSQFPHQTTRKTLCRSDNAMV